ncbi:hypothetical protein SAMN04487996_10444 [Dyadobacter soli]|uniref:Uncharacterized protein n=1 Tax=Dyadobacter soli TaxID=659014 RepID=A0A1G7B3F8_9BACT|nr:hypothetical protein [Dyadobacter soli]SDE20765.1 hypothetical protein SAMN04487996_10444 [Dyadobacter soli]
MGHSRSKVTFDCQCGKYYDGSCDHKSAVFMQYYHGTNFFEVVHKRHIDDPEEKPEKIIEGGDNILLALQRLLSLPDHQLERWDAADFDTFKAARGR